jgi:hypothetical protein
MRASLRLAAAAVDIFRLSALIDWPCTQLLVSQHSVGFTKSAERWCCVCENSGGGLSFLRLRMPTKSWRGCSRTSTSFSKKASVSSRPLMPKRDLSRLSRQRRWQLARVAEGRCSKCGKPRQHYPTMCDPCAVDNRRRMREKNGCKAWKPGGHGRPPVVAERSRKRSKRGVGRSQGQRRAGA